MTPIVGAATSRIGPGWTPAWFEMRAQTFHHILKLSRMVSELAEAIQYRPRRMV
jgi:hypothetical protein